MKLSKLIKTLQMAKLEYGDVAAALMNEETGDWWPLEACLAKPKTGKNRYTVHIPPIPEENRTPMTDLNENKTGHTGQENRTFETENRTYRVVKPDIAVSGEPSGIIKESSKEPSYLEPAADAASEDVYEPDVVFETLPEPGAAENSSILSQKDSKPKLAASEAEQLYKAFPRHVGRNAALKAIEKALKQHPFQQLSDAVTAYSRAVEGWPQEDKRFIPHPATWFNRGSYLDDPKEWERKAFPAKKGFDVRTETPLMEIKNTDDTPYFS